MGRYFLSTAMSQWLGFTFPYGTLCTNLLGCFAIGILAEWFVQAHLHQDIRLAVITGLLGGFTTFSAFSLETVTLFKNGEVLAAIGYIIASVGVGLAATWGGAGLFKLLFGGSFPG